MAKQRSGNSAIKLSNARGTLKRVVVHFMHEHEASEARRQLHAHGMVEETTAFMVGELDASAIAACRTKGMFVEELGAAFSDRAASDIHPVSATMTRQVRGASES